ncbi:MAG TPA: TonB-dependent receptor plug domain-containing protein, partial [bacterium]|nr:TonB-dependent receptor plug domain-containing protein [bacterium]
MRKCWQAVVAVASLAIAGPWLVPAISVGQDTADTTMAARATEDSLKTYAVPEILVTASRLPAKHPSDLTNVAVATSADLAELASSTVAEGLAADPGIAVTHYGSYGSLETMSLRGGNSSEVIYLLDGVPLADPQISTIDLNWLPMAGTSRVEAMKGGGSALYGSGAISGAVNVVSMDAMGAIPSSQITWRTASFASKAADVSLRRPIAGKVGVLGAYDYSKSAGWITNSAYRGDKYYGKVSADLAAALKLEGVGFTYNGNTEVPGSFPGLQKDRRRFYRLSLKASGDQGFTADYYHSTSNEVYVSESTIYGRSVYRHAGTQDGLQLEGYRRHGDEEATSWGAGFERRSINSNSVGKRSASDVYGFFQQEASE